MPILWKDVLKSAFTTSGVLSVTASGETKKHELFVDSWAILDQVSHILSA